MATARPRRLATMVHSRRRSREEMRVRRLGELEAAVMDRLWARSAPVHGREILQDLAPARVLAYTTVMTVLDSLHRKGLAARVMDGRAYRYSAKVSREAYTAGLVGAALSGAPDRPAVLLRFVEEMSALEVAALRAALADSAPASAGEADLPPAGKRRRR